MVSASQIRNELAFSLAGILPLDEFEDWFVQNTWNIQNTGSKAAEVLTFEIEELLSAYTSEHISEARLRDQLTNLLRAETKNVEVVDIDEPLWIPNVRLSFKGSASAVPARSLAG